MKILFYIEEFEDENNADVTCGTLVAQELARRNEVIVLSTTEAASSVNNLKSLEIVVDEKRGLKRYGYFNPSLQYTREIQKSLNWDTLDRKAKLKQLICDYHMVKGLLYIRKRWDKEDAPKMKALEKVASIEKPDVIVAVVYPYQSAVVLAKAKCDAKKVVYQLDPYSYNYTAPDKTGWHETEEFVLSHVDKIITTDLIKKDFESDEIFCKYKEKVYDLPYPNIRELKDECAVQIFDKAKINCVFAGNLYEKIRNPRRMLEVFSRIDNDGIVLHVFGKGCEDILGAYKSSMGDRLVIHGPVDGIVAKSVIIQADILVNINNDLPNQMASKVFDYISSGTPIINFETLENDPSVEYLMRYPYVFRVEGMQSVDDQLIDNIIDFCKKHAGQGCASKSILEIYEDCTISRVAMGFERAVAL